MPPASSASATLEQISSLTARWLGPALDPATVEPAPGLQRLVKRLLGKNATSPWAGSLAGGIIATVLALLLGFAYTVFDQSVVKGALTFPALDKIGATFSSILQALAQFERVTLISTFSNGPDSPSTVTRALNPLTLWSLIPALSVLAGSAVAAATDYARRPRYALARAIGGGVVYALLMWLLMIWFGGSSLTLPNGDAGTKVTTTIAGGSALFASLFWGVAIGALGAFVHLFGWHWRKGMLALALAKPRSAITAGALGGGFAVIAGVLLCVPIVAGVLGMETAIAGISDPTVSQQISPNVQHAIPFAKDVASQDGLPVSLAPTISQLDSRPVASPARLVLANSFGSAINLFAWSENATYGATQTDVQSGSYLSRGSSTSSSTNLPTVKDLGGFAILWFALPALVFFLGGRLAARLTQQTDLGQKLLAGLATGVAGSIALAILARFAQTQIAQQESSSSGSLFTLGMNLGNVLLGTLVFGAIFGALGAARYMPSVKVKNHPARPWILVTALVGIVFAGGLAALQVLGVSIVHDTLSADTFTSSILYSNTGLVLILQLLLGLPLIAFAAAILSDLAAFPLGSEALLQQVALAPEEPGMVLPTFALTADKRAALPRILRRAGGNLLVAALVVVALGGLLYMFNQLPSLLDQLVKAYS